MSSKQSTSKPDPRIAKKEVIVTRHKSAQMKRQLRIKDRSMKHVTDLLRSPTKDAHTVPKNIQKTKTPPKLKQSLLKSVEKVQKLPEKVFKLSKVLRKKVALVHDEEFYPNKRKRKIEVKRVVLKPSHELQMVASIVGSVKRKCGVPHRASSKSKAVDSEPSSPVHSELTMAEVIQMMEDDLTDEDMMEILTCPSPVWWEEGPGEEYIEEAIFRKSPEPPPIKTQKPVQKNKIDTPAQEENKAMDQAIEIPNLNKKSQNFLNKRSKLEGLLGNIKNKSNNKVNQSIENASNEGLKKICSNNAFNEDLVVICSNYRKEIDNSKDDLNSNKKVSDTDETRKRSRSESDGDEIIFHDTSMNEDELLRDLENMDIPIENSKQSDVIVIDDDDDDDPLDIPDKTKKQNTDKDIEDLQMNRVNVTVKTYSNERLNLVPKNMPILQKCVGREEVASPKSFDSCSSKISTSQDLDSISDTNINFIIDDEMDNNIKMTNDIVNEKAVVIKSEKDVKNESSKETNTNIKSMTVYRIVEETNDPKSQSVKNIELSKEKSIQDEKEDKSIKINDYYKKCKKVYKKKPKKELGKTDVNKNDVKINNECDNDDTKFMFCESCLPKTKQVSDDKNVKYCLKCSSIFDSTDCIYCIEKTKRNVYACVPCNTKFCCQVLYRAHYMHMHIK